MKDQNKRFSLLFLAVLTGLIGPHISASECPFAIIYSNPISTIGTKIECQAKIENVISASIPLGLLMKSNGYLWYCAIYQHSLPVGSIIKGGTLFIKGQYIGQTKILYEGSLLNLPLVFATEVKKF
ncbi:MAG: hypothetical protein N2316_07935 [Spirochaetes bacterium]|nr:hypothetical protein [Spirochaetota bacterium]